MHKQTNSCSEQWNVDFNWNDANCLLMQFDAHSFLLLSLVHSLCLIYFYYCCRLCDNKATEHYELSPQFKCLNLQIGVKETTKSCEYNGRTQLTKIMNLWICLFTLNARNAFACALCSMFTNVPSTVYMHWCPLNCSEFQRQQQIKWF